MAYNLPNVKPWVVGAANEIGSKFGIKSVLGWNNTEVGKYGSRDHPLGLALDFMTGSGDALANYAVSNAGRLGITYVIWNRRIWNPSAGWKPYTGTSNPHTDHVHVSFQNTAPSGGSIVGGALGGLGLGGSAVGGALDSGLVDAVRAAADSIGNIAKAQATQGKFADQVMKLALPTNIVRAVSGVIGIGFVLVGLFFLLREVR